MWMNSSNVILVGLAVSGKVQCTFGREWFKVCRIIPRLIPDTLKFVICCLLSNLFCKS